MPESATQHRLNDAGASIVSLSLTPQLLDAITQEAHRRGISRSALARQALAATLQAPAGNASR